MISSALINSNSTAIYAIYELSIKIPTLKSATLISYNTGVFRRSALIYLRFGHFRPLSVKCKCKSHFYCASYKLIEGTLQTVGLW